MMRKIILTAAVTVGLSAGLIAGERATFVLTDGTRETGEVVFHGPARVNIIENIFNLGVGGTEKGYPVHQVAIIDFAGDQPSVAEFQQLPAGNGQLLVLRGAGIHRGSLVNLSNGNTVLWQNESGQVQQYSIRDVSRIYLNPQAARSIYPQLAAVGPSGSPAAQGTAGFTDAPLPQGAIRVSANQPWVSTGIMVKKGQRIAFAASGQVQFSPESSHVSTADGNPNVQSPNLPVAAMSVGGLIGRVGGSQPFPIGTNRDPIVMPESGPLLLGVNDTNLADNAGSFTVMLSGTRR